MVAWLAEQQIESQLIAAFYYTCRFSGTQAKELPTMRSRMDSLLDGAPHTVEAVHSTHTQKHHIPITSLVGVCQNRTPSMSSLPSGGQSVSMSKQSFPSAHRSCEMHCACTKGTVPAHSSVLVACCRRLQAKPCMLGQRHRHMPNTVIMLPCKHVLSGDICQSNFSKLQIRAPGAGFEDSVIWRRRCAGKDSAQNTWPEQLHGSWKRKKLRRPR